MEIPKTILDEFQKSIESLNGFGRANLAVVLHDNYPRYTLSYEKSIVPGKPTSGSIRGERD